MMELVDMIDLGSIDFLIIQVRVLLIVFILYKHIYIYN